MIDSFSPMNSQLGLALADTARGFKCIAELENLTVCIWGS
jgi:hypothetical protein